MDNFVEELKKYFQETPREKVLSDWEKSKKSDEVGPTVDEFLKNMGDLTPPNPPKDREIHISGKSRKKK